MRSAGSRRRWLKFRGFALDLEETEQTLARALRLDGPCLLSSARRAEPNLFAIVACRARHFQSARGKFMGVGSVILALQTFAQVALLDRRVHIRDFDCGPGRHPSLDPLPPY
jgi:hypothetical protein